MGELIDDRNPPNGVRWDVNELKRWRREDIDPLKPAIMAYELIELRRDVQAMRRAFITFSFSVVGSAILFALTVFALLGHHG